MRKNFLKQLIATLIVTCLSTSVVFAQTADTNKSLGKTNQIQQSTQYYNDIIIHKGNVLTFDDFVDIKKDVDLLKSSNKTVTDDIVRELIVNKINSKTSISLSAKSYDVFGQQLTGEELSLVSLYPSIATIVYDDAKFASGQANYLYQPSTLWKGNGDAFRHAYWNALLHHDIGDQLATAFTTAHEANSSGVDKEMDLNNNAIGRLLGSYYSRSDVFRQVILATQNGNLWRIVNDQLVHTDDTGRN